MKQFEKTVYVSHKYGGDKNNLKKVEDIIKIQQKKHPNYMFISPLHMFGFLYNDMSYEDGLELCLYQLAECDEIWVTGDKWYDSTGVIKEIEYANAHKIDVLFVKDAEDNPHENKILIDNIGCFTKEAENDKTDNSEKATNNSNKINLLIPINNKDLIFSIFNVNDCENVQLTIRCPVCKFENDILIKRLGSVPTNQVIDLKAACALCHNVLDLQNLTDKAVHEKRWC